MWHSHSKNIILCTTQSNVAFTFQKHYPLCYTVKRGIHIPKILSTMLHSQTWHSHSKNIIHCATQSNVAFTFQKRYPLCYTVKLFGLQPDTPPREDTPYPPSRCAMSSPVGLIPGNLHRLFVLYADTLSERVPSIHHMGTRSAALWVRTLTTLINTKWSLRDIVSNLLRTSEVAFLCLLISSLHIPVELILENVLR